MPLFALTLSFTSKAQEEINVPATGLKQPSGNISGQSLNFINKKYTAITDAVDRQTLKMLQVMQRKEAGLQRKLQPMDSLKARQLFANSQANYQKLQARLQSPVGTNILNPLKQYLPGIDSTATVMHFLSGNNSVAADKLARVQSISSQVQQLQGRLQQANDDQAFVQEREQQLKAQLSQYGLGRQLLGMNKTAYYYQRQLQQYKDLINNREKLEQALLDKIRSLPAFQSFWQRNSILAQLFPMPGNNTGAAANAVTGLQTRAQIQDQLAIRMPSTSPGADPGSSSAGSGDPSLYMQQQLQNAQTQLNTLKDKLSQLGGGGSSNTTIPDFAPNNQHNKSFLKRITLGYNFQSTSSTSLLPAICNIGLSVGYKLSDKATVGTGAGYLLGIGRGFNNIAFTNQGVGLKSFVDIKAKGSIWVTGGYEYNYMQAFAKLGDLKKIEAWQKSALVGITKKYAIGKKEGNLQLLYDFLAEKAIPARQPLVFRIGYSF